MGGASGSIGGNFYRFHEIKLTARRLMLYKAVIAEDGGFCDESKVRSRKSKILITNPVNLLLIFSIYFAVFFDE